MAGTNGINLSPDTLKQLQDRGVNIKEALDTASANQQKLRKEAIEELRNDSDLKEKAQTVEDAITELLEPYFAEDEEGNPTTEAQVLPLLEEVLSNYRAKVKEHADNYVQTKVREEANEVRSTIEALREDWKKVNEQYQAAKVMLDMMSIDHSEVPPMPTLARGGGGGRSAGSGGGRRGGKTRDFQYMFTKDGKEFPNWENVSRALFYSSKGSAGSASDGRLTSKEFDELFRQQFGHTDTWKESWEIELPNGTKLGYTRTEKSVEEVADDSDTEEE